MQLIRRSQFLRFLLVGGVNTVFGYSVFALLIFLGVYYPVALAVSTVAGVLFNFATTGRLVFKNRDNSLLTRFIIIYLPVYLVNVVALKLLSELGVNHYAAQAISALPVALLSFGLNRRFVFRAQADVSKAT